MKNVPASSVLPYYLTGAAFFMVAQLLLIAVAPASAAHYFQPGLLAYTHLMALGWATMLIFGASNQLVPVISELPLKNKTIPLLTLFLLAGGVCLLSYCFYSFRLDWLIISGAALVLSGVLVHSIHIIFSCGGKSSIQLEFIKSAHVWLFVTAMLGLILLLNLLNPFLPEEHTKYLRVHAGMGMTGWFLLLITGVASKLMPMFLISHYENKKQLRLIYALLNCAALLFVINGFLWQSAIAGFTSFFLAVSAILVFLYYMVRVYRSRARKKTEPAMRQSFIAVFMSLLPFVLLLIALISEKEREISFLTATGLAFFAGFLSLLIMSITFKTLPFIVWMHSSAVRSDSGLLPKDMYSERFMTIHNCIYLAGVLGLLGALLSGMKMFLLPSAIVVATGAALYLIHVLIVSARIRK